MCISSSYQHYFVHLLITVVVPLAIAFIATLEPTTLRFKINPDILYFFAIPYLINAAANTRNLLFVVSVLALIILVLVASFKLSGVYLIVESLVLIMLTVVIHCVSGYIAIIRKQNLYI